MTFGEAKEKLQEIAAGRYCSIGYEENLFTSTSPGIRCSLGIGTGAIHYSSFRGQYPATWEAALENLRLNMEGAPLDFDQAPGEGVAA